MLGRAARRKPLSASAVGIAMITATNFIYMVPNSALTPIGVMLLGALAGYVRYDAKEMKDAVVAEEQFGEKRRGARYTRFPQNTTSTHL